MTHKKAFWLYYLGAILMVCAVIGLCLKSYELYLVSEMTELSKESKTSTDELVE